MQKKPTTEVREIINEHYSDQSDNIKLQLISVLRRSYDWACKNCHHTATAVKFDSDRVITSDCICKSINDRNEKIRVILDRSNIPPRYLNASLDTWKLTAIEKKQFDDNARVFGLISKYLSKLKLATAKGIGLYLVGPNGVGKTYIACAIGKLIATAGYDVRFHTFADIVRLETSGWRDDDAAQFIVDVKNSDFLIIDDIDKIYKSRTGLETALFDSLLRRRVQYNKPCIFTSNKTISEFGGEFGVHVSSLLTEQCVELVLVGSDFRSNFAVDNLRMIESDS